MQETPNESAPVAAASAGAGGSTPDPAPPAGSGVSIAIALLKLDTRCVLAHDAFNAMADTANTPADKVRHRAHAAGVSLVRSYIAEALRGAS